MTEHIGNITIKDENVSEILSHDIPYKLGKYEIKIELGRGACGIVYKGFDPFVRRDVAIKVGWGDPSGGNTQAQLDFFTEAHAAGRLQHPNIVALYDAQMEKELNYIVMEYIEGETLSIYCRKGSKSLQVAKAIECIYKCCLALDYSHQMGVIHRDIKPSNIMLTRDGETKLMDFSVADITHNRSQTSDMIIGSPNYMSPEQVLRREVGPQSDLYSLGAVLFELLTGKLLFPADNVKEIFQHVVHTPHPKLATLRPDLPIALSTLLDKALHKNPAERYNSGKSMAAELAVIYDNLVHAEHSMPAGDHRKILAGLKFFNQFNPEQLDEIIGISNFLSFTQSDVIGREGDIDNSYYIVMQGEVQVIKVQQTLALLRSGDCFGESASLTPNKRNTTLRAASHAALLKINALGLESLSLRTQLLFYKAFNDNLIYRLASGSTHRR